MLVIGNWSLVIRRNITAVPISTIGYCQDIFALQYRHLPPKNKKLKTGIKSNHVKGCLQ